MPIRSTTRTIDLSEVFSTNYPPLRYEADHDSIVFDGDNMIIDTYESETRPITLTATDILGQKVTTTFTLNSGGTLQTVAANEVRDNHYVEIDGKMVRTLLLEPAATNFTDDTIDGDQWSFGTGDGEVVSAESASPVSGPVHVFLPGTSDGTQIRQKGLSLPSGDVCLSAYVKPSGYNYAGFRLLGLHPSATGGGVLFDLADGTVHDVSLRESTPSIGYGIVDAGNGWYRIWVSINSDGGMGNVGLLVSNGEPLGSYDAPDYTGDGESGVLFTGLQLEAGSVPTSYIPTHGAPATREADSRIEWEVPGLDGTKPMTAYTRFINYSRKDKPLAVGGGVAPYFVQYKYGESFRAILSSGVGIHTSRPFLEPLVGGEEFELLTQANADGSGSFTEIVDGVEYTSSTESTAAGPQAFGASTVEVGEGYGYIAVEVFSGVRDLAYCRANRGDIFSYRPGDPLPEDAPSRGSAALQNAPAPADLPPAPAGWVFAFPDEAYEGGRVPVRDHEGNVVGTVVQGVDDAVGTSDPTITREGWSIDGSDSLRIDLVGDLNVARSASDIVVALTTTDTAWLLASGVTSGNPWVGVAQNGDGGVGTFSADTGSPSSWANGVHVAHSRTSHYAAWSTGSPVYAESRDVDMDDEPWNTIIFCGYNNYEMEGTVHGIALHLSDTEASELSRKQARRYVVARTKLRGVDLPGLPEIQPAGTVLVHDTFDYTGSYQNVSARTPNVDYIDYVGNGWQDIAPGASAGISSNGTATKKNDGTRVVGNYIDTGHDNFDLEFQFKHVEPNNNTQYFRANIRYKDSGTYLNLTPDLASGTDWNLLSRDNGGSNVIINTATGPNFKDTNWHDVKVEVRDNYITVYIDGVKIMDNIEATFLAGNTNVGFTPYGSSDLDWWPAVDNFKITAR